MTDTTNQTVAVSENAGAENNKKSVLNNKEFAKVSYFDSVSTAMAFLARKAEELPDLADYQLVGKGVTANDDGEMVFAPELYTEGTRVRIAKVEERLGNGVTKLRAIVMSPVPTAEQFMADEKGREWVARKLETAIGQAIARGFQKKDANDRYLYSMDDERLLEEIPGTLLDFATTSDRGESGLMEAFNEYWQVVKKQLASASKAFAARSPSKKEFMRAMQSKPYAVRVYPECEAIKTKTGTLSIFEFALQVFSNLASENGYDGSIFADWLANRATFEIDTASEQDSDDLELDVTAFAGLIAKPATVDTKSEDEANGEPAPAA
jgi:hypothetical protein